MAKTLFITGASSGIGAETARMAAKAGWNVALFARSAEKLQALADEIGDAALPLPGDATDLAAQQDAVARAVDRFGGIDAAFANAGRGMDTSGVVEGDADEIAGMIQLNITALVWTARATLPELKKRKGTLVLTGSAAGRRHIAGSIYGATKYFVHGFAGNMAEEMREWGGRCSLIAPGMVDTPFFDEGKPDKLQPEDVAGAVLYAIEADPRAAIREVYLMPQN
ncbi:NADP-dependent 3-hydroxy acid dehydrogenase YdfG [Palleronia marisminoris]|uniref:Putative oxidoreductase n=1 Tax=Palleronia marisminoris TaxID=315423 RepID=A0A1Y5RIH3_9RHOB|nr:SDR family oxidoreductase [Palleronia marisminoris]SFG15347.1 NADP-dependent 3-hydroxy acid dehydrogenase YdfG [Palleronia marisminoris]SLN15631.1 putative oxidoreductase [Palleronia marisminoris]